MYRNLTQQSQHPLRLYMCVCACVCYEQTALIYRCTKWSSVIVSAEEISDKSVFASTFSAEVNGTQAVFSLFRRLKTEAPNWTQTSGKKSLYKFVSAFCGITPSGSERLVDAVGFSGGTGACRAVLRRSGAPGDHAVAQGGHGWIRADPLYNTGQTVQTGNERPFTAAGICKEETGKLVFFSLN